MFKLHALMGGVALSALFAALLAVSAAAASADKPPNFLVLLVDDMGYGPSLVSFSFPLFLLSLSLFLSYSIAVACGKQPLRLLLIVPRYFPLATLSLSCTPAWLLQSLAPFSLSFLAPVQARPLPLPPIPSLLRC